MAGLIKRLIPWTSKPDYPVGIDWSNPLSKGIWDLRTYSDASNRNLVNSAKAENALGGVVGRVGRGLDFTGVSGEHIQITTENKFAVYTKFIIVEVDDRAGDNFISGSTSTQNNHAFWANGGQIQAGHNGIYDRVTAPADLQELLVLAVTYDGTTLRMYKTGIETANATISAPTYAIGGACFIGAFNYDSNRLNGRVYYTSIWDRALNPQEIKSLSASPYQLLQPRTQIIPFSTAAAMEAYYTNYYYNNLMVGR